MHFDDVRVDWVECDVVRRNRSRPNGGQPGLGRLLGWLVIAAWMSIAPPAQAGRVVAWGNTFANHPAPVDWENVVALAGGPYHMLALTAEGGVIGWGYDQYFESYVPSAATNVIGISAGMDHSLAVRADGQVVAWGRNNAGQVRVPFGLSNVVAVAAGFSISAALRSDGRVVCWGENWGGQTNVPANLSNVVAIAAGSSHFLALTRSGRVVAWGYNGAGRAAVPGDLADVVAIAAGNAHSLALRSDGRVVAWGDNAAGQTQVPASLERVVAVAAGAEHSLALDAAGRVVAWGKNDAGQSQVPASLASVVGIAAGSLYSYALVATPASPLATPLAVPFSRRTLLAPGAVWVRADQLPQGLTFEPATGRVTGTPLAEGLFPVELVFSNRFGLATNDLPLSVNAVVGWGDNSAGQITVPAGLTRVVALAGGIQHSLALTREGRVVAWGTNQYGQLNLPGDLSNVVAIAAGGAHNVVLTEARRLVGWGYPENGRTVAPAEATNVIAVAAGAGHNLALTAEGRVLAWGLNVDGQADVPANLLNVVAVAAGAYHSLALTADRTVVGWGAKSQGQSSAPAGLSNVTAIAAGAFHSLALTADGRVVGWGGNTYGQLNIPAGLSNVVAITAGTLHSAALTAAGRIVVWGTDLVPLKTVPELPPTAVALSAGAGHNLALIGTAPGLAPPQVLAPRFIVATEGHLVHERIFVRNGATRVEVEGLPPGLEFDPESGLLSGRPTYRGFAELTVKALNDQGTDRRAITMFVNEHRVLPVKPEIVAAPSTIAVPPGDQALFNVVALRATAYQWYFNGQAIPHATSATLTLPNVGPAVVGGYAVKVSNGFGEQTSDTVTLTLAAGLDWGPEHGPILLHRPLVVPVGQTLVVRAGTVVKCGPNGSLMFQGALAVRGTPDRPVVFTSIRDDQAGGDINGGGGASTPAVGDWPGLSFPGTVVSSLEHAQIRFADTAVNANYARSHVLLQSVRIENNRHGVYVYSPYVEVEAANCLIVNNTYEGVFVRADSREVFRNCTIAGNGFGGGKAAGIHLGGANLTLENCIVAFNRAGLQHDGDPPLLAIRFSDFHNPAGLNISWSGSGSDSIVQLGNKMIDPRFVDVAAGHYELAEGSPAIDCGTATGAPTTDLLGQPRHDDLGVSNGGAGYPAYVDLGAFERQADSVVPDLAVRSVSNPAPMVVHAGDTVKLDWTVANVGRKAVPDTNWIDAVVLSADANWSREDRLLGTVTNRFGLEPGGQYGATLTATVPADLVGPWYVLVHANATRTIPEPVEVDNLVASPGVLAVGVPVMSDPLAGTLVAGKWFYLRVEATAGEPLNLALHLARAVSGLQFFARYAEPPTAADHDAASTTLSPVDYQLRLMPSRTGTYYVGFLAATVPGGSAEFTLAGQPPSFRVDRVLPARTGNAGPASFKVEGDGFAPGAAVRLFGAGGRVLEGRVTVQDTGTLFADFTLTPAQAPPGRYGLRVTLPDARVAELSDAVTVESTSVGQFTARLSMPGLTRPGRVVELRIDYANPGTAPVPSPVLTLTNSAPDCQWLLPGEDRWITGPVVHLLALSSDGPPTILRPGQTETLIVRLKVPFRPERFRTWLGSMGALPDDGSALPINWNQLVADLRPPKLDDARWLPVENRLRTQLGRTWGDYAAALRGDAERVFAAGERVFSVRRLMQIELDRAFGLGSVLVAGRVIDSKTGLGISQATISAAVTGTRATAQATSGADGSFVLVGLAPGECRLRVRGYRVTANPVIVLSEQDRIGLALSVTPAARIDGQVLSARDRSPLAGASLELTDGLGQVIDQAVADPVGHFEFAELAAGAYSLAATAPGFEQPTAPSVVATAGSGTTVQLLLLPGASLRGQVRNSGGLPVAGVQVSARGSARGTFKLTTSGADGGYGIDGLPADDYTIEVHHPDFQPVAPVVVALTTAGNLQGVNFTLAAGGTLAFLVLDAADGRPVPGASVTAVQVGATSAPFAVLSDANGKCQATGLPAGTWTTSASHPDYRFATPVELPSSVLQTNAHTFQLARGSTLRGVLTDAAGKPLSDVSVVARGPDDSRGTARTDAAGRFVLGGLGAGVHELRAEGDAGPLGSMLTPPLVPGGTPFEIRFGVTAGPTVAGRVYSAETGEPIAEAVLTFLARDGGTLTLTTDAVGGFAGTNILAGPYYVRVQAAGYCAYQRYLEVPAPGGVTGWDIALTEGGILEGLLVAAGTEIPVAGALVNVESADGTGLLAATTDDTGRFRLTQVPPGEYRLQPRHDSMSFAAIAVTNRGGVGEFLRLIAASNQLEGLVLGGVSGTPVPGAVVRAYCGGESESRVSVTADQAGRFAFSSLQTGAYLLTAEAGGYGRCYQTVSIPLGNAGPVTMRLPTLVTLAGTIREAGTGTSVPGAFLFLRPEGVRNPDAGFTAESDADGRWAVQGAAAGVYQVTCVAPGYAAREITLNLNPGAPGDLVLERATGVTRIRFIDQASGLPIARARGLLSRERVPLAALTTDAAGLADLPVLPPGEYDLDLVGASPVWSGRFTVHGAGAEEVAIPLATHLPGAPASRLASLGIVSVLPASVAVQGGDEPITQCGYCPDELRLRMMAELYLFPGATAVVSWDHLTHFLNKLPERVGGRYPPVYHGPGSLAVKEIVTDGRWQNFVGRIQTGKAVQLDTGIYRFSRQDGARIVESCLSQGTSVYGDRYDFSLPKWSNMFHGVGLGTPDLNWAYGGINRFDFALHHPTVPDLSAPTAVTASGQKWLRFTVQADTTYTLNDTWVMLKNFGDFFGLPMPAPENVLGLTCLQDCYGYPTDDTVTVIHDPSFSAFADLPAVTLHLEQTEGGTIEVADYSGGAGVANGSDYWFTRQTTVNCNAVPDPGYHLVSWENGPGVVMSADQTVSATFEKDEEPEPDNPGEPEDEADTDVQTSRTPEDKFGPAGADPAGTAAADLRRFAAPGWPMTYRVEFWNQTNAVVSTQDATIDDTLDPRLFDLSTFAFTRVGFLKWDRVLDGHPATSLQLRIDARPELTVAVDVSASLDPVTGRAHWWFHAVDPVTGDSPADPFAGFLPAFNPATGYELGWVEYRVNTRSDLPTGTVVTNQAWVQFDFLGPINPAPKAGPWANTMDASLPASAISPLPALSPATFDVSWSGQDDQAGVASFDIFVSTNRGPWQIWLARTTATTARFHGAAGVRYGFASVARDRAGNLEPLPSLPDAETQVVADAPPPVLAVAPAGLFLELSWPAAATDYRLESVDALPSDRPWEPVTDPVNLVGGRSVVLVQPGTISRFYRLRRP